MVWYQKEGAQDDVVVSTRIRLARNMKTMPFPCRATDEQQRALWQRAEQAAGEGRFPQEFSCHAMADCTQPMGFSLVERHLISPEFPKKREFGLLLSADESVSIMVNEEDHLRIQVLGEGLSLQQCYETADLFDDFFDERLQFAYDPQLGYLTQCPTNLGTGLRASVMLHLPMLQRNQSMGKLSASLTQMGMTIRGTYGEDSGVASAMYQISNQVTLGIRERDVIESLAAVTEKIIADEQILRTAISKKPEWIDRIQRAKAVLENGYLIRDNEMFELVSMVRLGVSLGLWKEISVRQLNEILFSMGKYCLIAQDPICKEEQKRARIRAQRIQNLLANNTKGE